MVLPAASTIATYTDDTTNFKTDSNVRVIEGVMTFSNTGQPITDTVLSSRNTGQTLISKNTGSLIIGAV